ncbi:MAG TPA: mucoidy inhibitor MuiA family protein [Hyalangium sp.]|nr:mucoidy inhibitor MuiA family protein [Hyalangium sp.]
MLVVPSVLDAVTVHADGALCTRLATVPAENGRLPTQVRINGLPLGLTTGSLRASVLQGPAGLAVRDIRPAFDAQLPPEPDVPAEQRALEEAQEALASVTLELQRVQRDVEATQELSPSFLEPKKGDPPREASPTSVLTLASFVDEELAALLSRKLDLERRQRDAMAEVELRRRRLQEGSSAVRGQRAVLYRAAVITLSAVGTGEGETRLMLEYAVRGARWVPGYELRMPRSLDGGTLRMRASVLQRTGEDWQNVKLSLSTAELNRRADVPELKALRIGRRQPPPARSGWREPPPGLDELFTGYDSAGRPPVPAPPPPPPKTAPIVAKPKGEARDRTATGEIPVSGDMRQQMAPSSTTVPLPESISAEAPAEYAEALASPAAPAPLPAMKKGGFLSGIRSAPGGPPPPAPSAPAAAAPRRSMASRGGGSLERQRTGASRNESAKKDAAYEEEAAPMMDLDEGGALGGFGGAAPSEPEPPSGIELGGSLLDYDSLELPPPNQPGLRGRLQPRPVWSSQELLALTAVHVQVDIISLIATRQQSMEAVQHISPPTWAVPPRQSTPHFDYRYDVETRMDVPSDSVWHTVSVFSAPVGLSAEYLCVPSMEPQVFRTVKVENRTPHALLAGPVDVTLGDEFLMTSPLPTLAPGATQRLGLGVEESIKVSRNTRFDEATGGVFGGATVLTHRVSVEVANRLGRPVLVEIRERVPVVPKDEKDIKLEETEIKPAWRPPETLPGDTPVDGERAWRVTVQPGEKQSLEAAWAVKIPSSKMLQGGNRRT